MLFQKIPYDGEYGSNKVPDENWDDSWHNTFELRQPETKTDTEKNDRTNILIPQENLCQPNVNENSSMTKTETEKNDRTSILIPQKNLYQLDVNENSITNHNSAQGVLLNKEENKSTMKWNNLQNNINAISLEPINTSINDKKFDSMLETESAAPVIAIENTNADASNTISKDVKTNSVMDKIDCSNLPNIQFQTSPNACEDRNDNVALKQYEHISRTISSSCPSS